MFQIIIKETKEFLRDKSNIFFFFIFPVILVFLLGNLLSNMDKAEEVIGEVKIHYGIEGVSDINIMTVKEFIKGIEDRKNFYFDESNDFDVSLSLASEGGIDAVVWFKNDPMEIHIYEGLNKIKNRTVNSIMNGFSQLNKAVNITIKRNPQSLANKKDYEPDYIKHKDLGIKRTMLDYYAITMMTMMCFMSVMLGAVCFMGERQENTINRLRIAPISQVKLFFGKIFGLLPQTLLQILILMVFSTFMFGAHYASNFLDNIYLFFMFTVISYYDFNRCYLRFIY
ncbi:MAG TPA: ABC transporter permease [Mobilitalea sp.]|nr:ABC transporter permease [Mobilitalea sp.]